MSTALIELFDIFSKTYTKEEAKAIVKDIEELIAGHRRELTTKSDLKETELRLNIEISEIHKEIISIRNDITETRNDIAEVHKKIADVELRLTKDIEQSKSSTIKWLVGWMAALIMVQTGAIITIFTLLK